MADKISIDQLVADLERARTDPQIPSWVVLLLQAVVVLVQGMSAQLEAVLLRQAQSDERQAQSDERTEELNATIAKLRKALYGQKSEKTREKSKKEKTRFKTPALDPAKTKRRNRTGQAALDQAEMPEEHETHVLPEPDKVCDVCGGDDFVRMPGTDDTSEYIYREAHLIRRHHHREKWACRQGCSVHTAPGPQRVVDGGRFHASVYANIVTKRSLDAIPFHRQADAMQRTGVPLSASTICDLFHDAARVLEPLYDALADEIRGSPLVHADETPQPVIDIGKTRRAYIWTFASASLALFVHTHGRGGDTPKNLLDKTVGVLVADGYSGYNVVEGPDSRTRAGCLAHARRKFVEAEKQSPRNVAWLIDRVAKIYAVESEARALGIDGTAQHLVMRQARSRPLMDEIHAWLHKKLRTARPKSPFGKAVSYMNNQWPRLLVFLDDAMVPPDNNHAERLLRRTALGRKNSLFVASDENGQRYAINMSLVSSCRLNGINPAAYLTDVLPRVADTKVKDLRNLLPDRWQSALA